VREELQPAEKGNPPAARPGNQTARPGPICVKNFPARPDRAGPTGRPARAEL